MARSDAAIIYDIGQLVDSLNVYVQEGLDQDIAFSFVYDQDRSDGNYVAFSASKTLATIPEDSTEG